ncbi:MAG: very short patch repair endonuclease [Terriglobales bacterium]
MTPTSALRSRIMRAVKSRDTAPELVVRRLAHGMGYRFRLHRRELPGTPDLVFPCRRTVLFVNGCFWHGHNCRRGRRRPKRNAAYWRRKIGRNRGRDRAAAASLRGAGWRVGIVWECELAALSAVRRRLRKLLGRRPAWPRPRKKERR